MYFTLYVEGLQTETNYFHSFNDRYSRIIVKSFHGGYTDPQGIVNYAISLKRKEKLNIRSGDRIWCVFDVNSHSNHILQMASQLADKFEIPIALSNPCFELWLILHYFFHSYAITHDEAPEKLAEYIPGYEKNMDIFYLVEDLVNDAIANARRLNSTHNQDGTDLFSRESNPSSQVYRLVEEIFLMKEASDNL